jgi:hypothetical protein
MIATGAYAAAATPGPWVAVETAGRGWLVRGGADRVIAAMVRRRSDEAELAARIAGTLPT